MPHRVTLQTPDDFDGWREAARSLAMAGVHPADVSWGIAGGAGDLFADAPPPLPPPDGQRVLSVPKPFLDLARQAVLHSDPERFALLYEQLIALSDKRASMDDRADPRLDRLQTLAKAVRRDSHKMHAFVRFREVEEEGVARFVAFFEPDHHIVRANAGFFVRRFASLRWSILTPEVSLHWDGEVVREGPGATRADAPDGDPVEELWKSYFKSIFNPARLKVGAMLSEMPKKYWANMPETALVPAMIAGAQQREAAMIANSPQPSAPPPHASAPGLPLDEVRTARGGSNAEGALAALREEASQCRRCPLWEPATQVVFGQGPADAALVMVGEQAGDQEDRAGLPFVGPAGQMLDRAMAEAGLDRSTVYVTNAVKHFKYEWRGKRRIHQTPGTDEIAACSWWQEREREIIAPRITLALGGTAGRALTGKPVTIGKMRGSPHPLATGGELWITYHPSYLLRIPDAERAEAERVKFVGDLKQVRERLAELA